jgi:hypothetical protein
VRDQVSHPSNETICLESLVVIRAWLC